MTALDFMMGCIGTGIFFVCAAWSVKILSDTRTRVRSARELVQRKDEPLDPMGQRLQELRGARFGRPMADPIDVPLRPPPTTWPVMTPPRPRPQPKPPLPDDKRKVTKDEGKKQGGK